MTDFESDVSLDWAFYQRAFHEGTTLKIGRMPIPRGIYNELRSVGVALPMYRPPVVFYDEGAYYSETIDGAIVSHTFAESSPWSLETHGYVGGWRSLAYDTWSEQYSIQRVRAENAVGTQLWLNTPIDGVRLGYRVTVPLSLTRFVELHPGDPEAAVAAMRDAGVEVLGSIVRRP